LVLDADLVSDSHVSDGFLGLSEAGVDEFISGLLVSPGESSVDQSGLSDSWSVGTWEVKASRGDVVDVDDVSDSTPISVLLPRVGGNSSTPAKRKLDSSFG
ncbi:hypothetical protein A2U01_0048957, partial [Trifolium medium]|nr:hypothetical protein [Trifolium medium]